MQLDIHMLHDKISLTYTLNRSESGHSLFWPELGHFFLPRSVWAAKFFYFDQFLPYFGGFFAQRQFLRFKK